MYRVIASLYNKGYKLGYIKTSIMNCKNLIENTHMNVDDAMKMIDMPIEAKNSLLEYIKGNTDFMNEQYIDIDCIELDKDTIERSYDKVFFEYLIIYCDNEISIDVLCEKGERYLKELKERYDKPYDYITPMSFAGKVSYDILRLKYRCLMNYDELDLLYRLIRFYEYAGRDNNDHFYVLNEDSNKEYLGGIFDDLYQCIEKDNMMAIEDMIIHFEYEGSEKQFNWDF